MQDGFDEKAEDRFACVERATAYREGMSTTFGEELRAARVAAKLSKAELARRLDISGSAISQWESGDTRPEIPRFFRLVKELDLDLTKDSLADFLRSMNIPLSSIDFDASPQNIQDSILEMMALKGIESPNYELLAPNKPFGKDVVGTSNAGADVVTIQAKNYQPFERLQGLARDIPVKGIAVAGEDGDFRFNGEDADWAIRPPGLATAKGIFAVHVVSDSMYPAWRPGSLLYVTPHRPPSLGDDCIIEMLPGADGEPGAAYLKRFIRREAGRLVVEQFNPPKELIFNISAVRIFRVIPWEEALGLTP